MNCSVKIKIVLAFLLLVFSFFYYLHKYSPKASNRQNNIIATKINENFANQPFRTNKKEASGNNNKEASGERSEVSFHWCNETFSKFPDIAYDENQILENKKLSLRHIYKWRNLHCHSVLGLFNELENTDSDGLDKHLPEGKAKGKKNGNRAGEEPEEPEEDLEKTSNNEAILLCKKWWEEYEVRPGESFGSLPKKYHGKWNSLDCDTFVLTKIWEKGTDASKEKENAKQILVEKCRSFEKKYNLDVNSDRGLSVMDKADKKEYSRLHCTSRIVESLITGHPTVDCAKSSAEDFSKMPWIAVAVSATTRKIRFKNIEELALFSILLPSLVQTAECGFRYRVVLAYDYGDPFFDSPNGQRKTIEWFEAKMRKRLADSGIQSELLLAPVKNKVKKPGPAFEVMTRMAYDVGSDYIYRVNDDTQFIEPFANVMVSTLQAMGRPYGVVGPRCHGQSTRILTHDFTHREHMDIFNRYYYPPQLSDWWMDDWISRVYGKSRTRMALSAKVFHHTGKHGSRYKVDQSHKHFLEGLIKEGHARIADYMARQKLLTKREIAQFLRDRTDGKSYEMV